MRRRVGLGIWLVAVWVALEGEITLGNIVGGALIATILIVVLPNPRRPPNREHFRPIPALKWAADFVWRALVANAMVVSEIVTKRQLLEEGVIRVPFPPMSDGLTTLYTNTITLTPGTLVLDVEPDTRNIYVHVMHRKDLEAERGALERSATLIIEAFGSDVAIHQIHSGEIHSGEIHASADAERKGRSS